MSFSRSFLKNNGLNDEQIAAVMEEHLTVFNQVKAERDNYKAEAEKLPALQQEITTLKSAEDFKTKYEQEHSDFEAYKKQVAQDAQTEKVKAAYRKLLADEHINEKRFDGILRLTDFSGMKLDKDGNLEGLQALKDDIGKQWGEYRVETKQRFPKPETPPNVDNGQGTSGIREMTAKWHAAKYGTKTNE